MIVHSRYNLFSPLHALSDARVGANHFIIPSNTTHVFFVVVNQFELSDNIALTVTVSSVNNIGLVNSR